MTRKAAMLSLLGMWVADTLRAQQKTNEPTLKFAEQQPMKLNLSLSYFGGIEITYKGKSRSISVDEIWEALGDDVKPEKGEK